MKYNLICKKCGAVINNFAEWFENDQLCPECGSNHVEVKYDADALKAGVDNQLNRALQFLRTGK